MKDLTLVVMAAGMGSRFGGLKQIEPVGPNGEIIADYSVFDALRAGFNKVVFIIRKENLEYFQKNITSKFDDKIKVEFAFQEFDIMVPNDVKIPKTREKMLGTGHAVLCAKDVIDSDFVIINGDDFYGLSAFEKAKMFFDTEAKDDEYVTVNYPISMTMSKNGTVKRGVCFLEGDYVKNTIESEIRDENGKYIAKSLIDGHEYEISKDTPVSVNFMGFHKEFLSLLEDKFNAFIHGEITDKNECLLPEVLKELIKEGKLRGKAKTAESKWMGITYREDLDEFKNDLNELISEGKYPEKLW